MKANRNIVLGLMLIFVSVIVFFENYTAQEDHFWKEVIASDGRGYYAYLPSLFLYGETDFSRVVEREQQIYPTVHAANFMSDVDGKPVNKYFLGVALLMLPFFLSASLISWLAGITPDGYNAVYQLMTSVAAVFYLFAGLIYLRKLLKLFRFAGRIVDWTLILTLFATNLLIYTVAAPAMSHVYSFAAVAGLMFHAAAYFRNFEKKHAFGAVVWLALIVLIRPANGIIIFVLPVLAPGFKRFAEAAKVFFASGWSYLFLLSGVLLLALQPVWWHFETGKWLVWSYSGEGFYFTRPQVLNVLFSFRKGLFVYTPLCLIATLGLIPLYRSDKTKALFAGLFLLLYVWLVSSWWNWYYGDSFGQRVFIDIFPVFALLLAWFLQWVSEIKRIGNAVFVLLSAVLFLNLFQSWQYSRGIIHPYAMDRQKYAMVFLRTGSQYRHIFNDLTDVPPYGTDLGHPLKTWKNDFEKVEPQWVTSGRVAVDNAHSGRFVSRLNESQPYSSALLITGDTSLVMKKNLYARGSVCVFEVDSISPERPRLVISLNDSTGKNVYWRSTVIDEIPVSNPSHWRTINFGITLPVLRTTGDRLKIFIWYRGKTDVLVDDFGITLFGPGR